MNFFRRLISREPRGDYRTEWDVLRKKHAFPIVPNVELATTRQALVVCCGHILDRIWIAECGIEWDEGSEAEYVVPLRDILAVDEMFSVKERRRIQNCLDEIVTAGKRNIEEAKKGIEDW